MRTETKGNTVKKEEKKKKPAYARSKEQKTTHMLLVAILIVGLCLIGIAVVGMVSVMNAPAKQPIADNNNNSSINTDMINNNAPNNDMNTPTQPDNHATPTPDNNAPAQNGEQTPGGNAGVPQTDAEWLTFFNNSVNKLKTDGPAFTKSKKVSTTDIQLSNKLAQAYVGTMKDKYLSEDTVVTKIAKGDKAAAVKEVTPDGSSFVSTLALSDIKSISHNADSNGNYVIRISMPDATSPDKTNSSYAKIFSFITVDDVMNTYAPDMGATVDRANTALKFSGCYAEAVIKPDGTLVKYEINLATHMILGSAKISFVTTDVDAALSSHTVYDNIVW